MKKYGFVYIWYDRKHKRYYIGCRWGNENDRYICSSTWMKNAHKRRPDDFKRKIVSRIYSCRRDLLNEEYRWLSMIKEEELGKKYYNLHNHCFGHWSTNSETAKIVLQKQAETVSNMSEDKKNEMKRKQSVAKKGKRMSTKTEFKKGQIPWNKGLKGVQIAWNKGIVGENNHNYGKQRSEETRTKISNAQKGVSRKSGMAGKKHSEVTKMKISMSKRENA
jgi:hypothetical protein